MATEEMGNTGERWPRSGGKKQDILLSLLIHDTHRGTFNRKEVMTHMGLKGEVQSRDRHGSHYPKRELLKSWEHSNNTKSPIECTQ